MKAKQIIAAVIALGTCLASAKTFPDRDGSVPSMTLQKRQEFLIYTAEFGKSYDDTYEF